jgi:hypothetical protein
LDQLRPGASHLTKGWQIEFRIDRGGVEASVSKEVGNFLETAPLSHHAARHRVTEDVGSREWCFDFGAMKSTDHNLRDRATRDRLTTMRTKVFHEHTALIGLRALTAQVGDNSAASVAWKRKDSASAGLAGVQPDGAVPPVNVLETKVCNLTGPEPKGSETPHNGTISLTARCGDVHRREQLFELLVP